MSATEFAAAWRDAAIADGWDHEPTYGTHEDELRACRLSRDGWKAQVITRGLPTDKVSAWGPDGLAVCIAEPYDWTALQDGLRTCAYCGAKDVDTQRLAFAGRCCAECLPAMREKHEFPGWEN